jgi:hypothetical protein
MCVLNTLKGEACVNNRKNKLIPAYELEVTLKWEGQAAGAAGAPVTGQGSEFHRHRPRPAHRH